MLPCVRAMVPVCTLQGTPVAGAPSRHAASMGGRCAQYRGVLPELWEGEYCAQRGSHGCSLAHPRGLTVLCPPGLDIHFIHVKPPQPPSGCTPKPLLMVHGWPGSFYEFYKIIPLLTDPRSHGLSEEHVFEVICPSIPGYGFSEASSKKGTECYWGL